MNIVKWKKPSAEGPEMNQVLFNSPLSGLFENFFGDDFFTKEYASHVPAVNISEEKDRYNMELAAPGFEKDDFKIELNKGMFTVSAQHKTEKETKEKTFSRKEFNYGSFQRNFSLPEEINEDAIVAKYENGILKISLPKKEEAKKEKKEIKIS